LIKTNSGFSEIHVSEKPDCLTGHTPSKPKTPPKAKTSNNKQSTTSTASSSPKPSTSTSSNFGPSDEPDDYCPMINNDTESSDDDTEQKGRLEWGICKSRKLLAVYKEKAESLQSTKNKKKIWKQIAKSVSSDTTLKVTGEQARERFYTIKRSYRKYLTESKKTGNRRPKIFLLETEMADILQNDPTFKPICTRDSLAISGSVVEEKKGRQKRQIRSYPTG